VNIRLRVLALSLVTAALILCVTLLAQPPAGPGVAGPGAPAGPGRGRGGGGFVANPAFDSVRPELPGDLKPGGILIFSKTNGFREEAAFRRRIPRWRPFVTNEDGPTS
jgi:hypothetical protein